MKKEKMREKMKHLHLGWLKARRKEMPKGKKTQKPREMLRGLQMGLY